MWDSNRIGGQQQKKSYFIQADDDGIGEKCKVNKKIAKHAASKSCQTFQLFTVRVHTSGQDASITLLIFTGKKTIEIFQTFLVLKELFAFIDFLEWNFPYTEP